MVVWGPSDNSLQRRTGFKSGEDIIRAVTDLATPDILAAVVEHVHSMRSDGRKSSWTFGLATGTAHAGLFLSGLPWIEVNPLRWQNFIRKDLHWSWDAEFDSREAAKKILNDPRWSSWFRYVKDHNTGDAFCMAYWLHKHIRLMPDSSNRLGHLRRLPAFQELQQLRAERLGQKVPVV